MDLWLLWLIVGFVLVIAELMTGTFYLLVIGLGAFVGAMVAWFVHHWHEAQKNVDTGVSNFLDRGQPVVLEGWTNEPAGIARVRYRGASWDARVAEPASRPVAGATLYIHGQEGNTLVVSAQPTR